MNLGIDLGTSRIVIYGPAVGVVLDEPSVIALDSASGRVIACGDEAQQMLGRTPGNITAVRPLRDGVISQYDVTLKMMQYFIRLKIEKAKKLLRENEISVTQISETLAFDTPNYFSKTFKKITGYTPLQYKKIHQSNA